MKKINKLEMRHKGMKEFSKFLKGRNRIARAPLYHMQSTICIMDMVNLKCLVPTNSVPYDNFQNISKM